MKASLDIQIVVADQIRFGTDPVLFAAALSAIKSKTASGVRLVATKIDVSLLITMLDFILIRSPGIV